MDSGQVVWARGLPAWGLQAAVDLQSGRRRGCGGSLSKVSLAGSAGSQAERQPGSRGQPRAAMVSPSACQPRSAAGSRGQPRSAGPVLWSQPAQARLSREESLVESEGHAKAKIILVAISKRDPVDPVGLGSRAIGAGGQGSGGRDSSKLRPRRHRSRTDRLQNLLSTLGGGAYG